MLKVQPANNPDTLTFTGKVTVGDLYDGVCCPNCNWLVINITDSLISGTCQKCHFHNSVNKDSFTEDLFLTYCEENNLNPTRMKQETGNRVIWNLATKPPPSVFDDRSDSMLLALEKEQYEKNPQVLVGWYDYYRNEWRTNMGTIDRTVTHWQEMNYPDEQGE